MTALRAQVRPAVALCLLLGVAALAAVADLVATELGEALVARLGDPRLTLAAQATAVRQQVAAARWLLWLGAAAIGALAVALTWAALHLLVLRRIEAAARTLGADEVGPTQPDADEIARLQAALDAYRNELGRERQTRADGLAALGALRDAAEAVAARLQHADRLALVGRVAMGMAHEIGGPLAIVLGFLERLDALERADRPLDDRLRCVDQARHAAERIHALLSDMAAPGLPQARDVDRPCDAVAVALRVEAQCEQHPRARELTIDLIADGGAPCDISASHLEQVLMNLVVNAADAKGSAGNVRIEVRRDGDWLAIDVDDDGPGIPAADRERIFDEFYTTKAAAPGEATRRSGWGLGLAVSRRIVGRYGGTLHAGAAPAGGARMSLRLPVPANLRKAARASGVRQAP